MTFYTYEIHIAADMGWYMNSALNLFMGKGYTNMDGSLILNRGPVFPLMIAASYWLLGVSPWSAFWVVRIFCILNPIIIYFLGKKFYGEWVGFSAALLILTSYSMNYWSYRHLDAVWPFFVLSATYFVCLGFERNKFLYFLMSGVSFGLAYLVKEVAILFFPLPLLMFLIIKDYRRKKFLYGVSANIAVIFLVILPWFYYLHHHSMSAPIIGKAGPFVINDLVRLFNNGCAVDHGGILDNFFGAANQYFLAFWHYYYGRRNSLDANFLHAPGFLVAWIFILISAVRGNRYSKVLTLIALLFLPILCFLGMNDCRLGQGILFFLLSYLALVAFLSWIAQKISRSGSERTQYGSMIFIITLVLLLIAQVFLNRKNDLGYKNFIRNSLFYEFIVDGEKQGRVAGRFESHLFDQAIQETSKIVVPGDKIVVDWYHDARLTYFKMKGEYPVFTMPFLWCTQKGIIIGKKPSQPGEKPLFIHSNSIPLSPQYELFMLFESQMIEQLKRERIKYVLITPRFWQLNGYFSNSSAFEEIITVGPRNKENKAYRVYHVLEYERSKEEVSSIFTERFKKTMAKMKTDNPKKYEYFRDNYIYDMGCLTRAEFE